MIWRAIKVNVPLKSTSPPSPSVIANSRVAGINKILIYVWYKITFLDLGKAKSANINYLKIALSRKLSALKKIN